MPKSAYLIVAALLLALFSGGCAAPPERPRVLFPPPPDEPRMEFVGTYASQNDFPKTGWEAFRDKYIGSPPPARFSGPMGIVSDGAGTVYVSDIFDRNIRIYDFNARTVDYMFKVPVFGSPFGLALDGQGRMYVADGDKGVVFVVSTEERRPLFTIGDPEILTKPVSVAVNDELGRLYVSDVHGMRVVVFDLEGNHLFSFGEYGNGDGQFYAPQGVAIDAEDRVFVVDQLNARIQAFDADGGYLHQFGERGDQAHQFEAPSDLGFDSEGNLHVVDKRKPYFATFTPEGRLLLTTGGSKPTTMILGFSTPQMIHVDATDRIFITDYLNTRFAVWQYASEAYLEEHPVTEEDLRRMQEGFAAPER